MKHPQNRVDNLDRTMARNPRKPIPLADAFVHVQSAFTSLAQLGRLGMIGRDGHFYARVCPLVGHVVMVTYGGAGDTEFAAALPPKSWRGTIECVGNETGLETAVFQAGVPERVLERLEKRKCRRVLVYVDQHHGGEVAAQTARVLRASGMRVGLVARCGYHWSWTVARDTATNDPRALAAAMLEGELCREADVVVATTKRIAENLSWQHRLEAGASGRVRVVPNFVAPVGAMPSFSRRTRGVVLYAGRLDPEKRVDLLIRAAAKAAKSVPGLRLVVIGDGSMAAELRRIAEACGAPVEFRERVAHAELLREMGRCNVYAQVSRFEGHPKTILEAMAMGAPTLVTRGPGVDDEINPNVTGLATGDAEADIAGGLVWLMHNPELAKRMGERAAKDIRSRLSYGVTLPKMEEAFRLAMELGGVGAGGRAAVSPVRWEQTLLNAGPDGAAAEFVSSIGAYVKRLDPRVRTMFLDGVAARLGSLVEGARDGAATPSRDARASRR
jgi:glycosyltransferase involved in cell wall biosynthesis